MGHLRLGDVCGPSQSHWLLVSLSNCLFRACSDLHFAPETYNNSLFSFCFFSPKSHQRISVTWLLTCWQMCTLTCTLTAVLTVNLNEHLWEKSRASGGNKKPAIFSQTVAAARCNYDTYRTNESNHHLNHLRSWWRASTMTCLGVCVVLLCSCSPTHHRIRCIWG